MQKIRKYLAEFVYGSIDGTVTTFAIISGIAGAKLSPAIVLILGVSNVLADGFSMASSNYLSEKSHQAVEGTSNHHPLKGALMTYASFVLVGAIPLLSYIGSFAFGWWEGDEFTVSIVLTTLAFLLIGNIRGKVAGVSRVRAALETLLIGGIAALVSYSVGAGLERLIR